MPSTSPPAALALLALSGCGLLQPLPNEVVLEAAKHATNLGHPHAEFIDARVVGSSSGSLFSSGTHDTFVDVASRYRRKQGEETMTLRFYVHSTDPCKITTDVLTDTGPKPILLDNGVASEAVGKAICDELAKAQP